MEKFFMERTRTWGMKPNARTDTTTLVPLSGEDWLITEAL